MHASIWTFRGDPDELSARYEALLAEVPAENMRLHLCLRSPEGIVLVDTCPSREVFLGFQGAFLPMLESHGLPVPEVHDYSVEAAFVEGQRTVETTAIG